MEAGGRGHHVSRRPFTGAGTATAPNSTVFARAPLDSPAPIGVDVSCPARASCLWGGREEVQGTMEQREEKGGGAGDDGAAGGRHAAEGTGEQNGLADTRTIVTFRVSGL